MDKVTIIRKKCARGMLLAMLYDHQSAAVMLRTLEYAIMQDDPHISTEIDAHVYYLADKGYVKVYHDGEEMTLASNPPRDALIRLTAKGIDLMEGTIEDDGVAFGDPARQ